LPGFICTSPTGDIGHGGPFEFAGDANTREDGARRGSHRNGEDHEEHSDFRGSLMSDGPPGDGGSGAEPVPPRRSTEDAIAQSIDLGWRVAALYALRPTTLKPPEPVAPDMLLNRRSLSASDRVELEVRAIAGVADDVGVTLSDAELSGLLGLADGAGRSTVREQTFRNDVARQHLSFEKRLWATDESRGKAYELGNFVSDSWNRMLRPEAGSDPHSELRDVFSDVRVERMKHLLDDLQARVDPVAAHTVTNHLDQWRDRVASAPAPQPDPRPMTPDEVAAEFEPLERQTIIWRQILTGDKEPESWIGHARRVEVRDELTKQLWRRYRRPLPWLVPLVIVVVGALYLLYDHNKDTAKDVGGILLAALGALGITRATMIGTVRRGLQSWGDLMWNRSLAAVICRETSVVDDLLPPAVTRTERVRKGLGWN
jgi:hypothetical protein